jgi:hypothetical protein
LAKTLIELFEKHKLRGKKINYVKDKGSNLSTMTTTLKRVISYDILGLEESYQNLIWACIFQGLSIHYNK